MPLEIMDQRDMCMTSELFKKTPFLSETRIGFGKPKSMLDQQASWCGVEEPLVSTKKTEMQSIENLLPDEDDLFSGMIDKLRCNSPSTNSDDDEDFDLFHCGGGMEIEVDNCLNSCKENSNSTVEVFNGRGSSNSLIVSKHPYREHSSRTLFVRNINNCLDDSELRTLFELYGDIKTLYTACKHQGLAIISYYDIRAAWNVMSSRQNKPLRHMNLDIHYSILKDNPSEKYIHLDTLVVYNLDSLVSTDEIHRIFGRFGEIKEIGKSPHQLYHKFIEFYDIRAAKAAYLAMNNSNITGKQIKLELSHSEGARQCVMQQFTPLTQDEISLCRNLNDNSSSEEIGTVSPIVMTPCIVGGSICYLQSKSEMAVNSLNEKAFSHVSFSVPKAATVCNLFEPCEARRSLDQGKLGTQCSQSYHLHSRPEYFDGSANVVPYNSLSTFGDLKFDGGPRIVEGLNDSCVYAVDSKGQQVGLRGGVFGSSWTSDCSSHGDHYAQQYPSSLQQLPTSPLVWLNSPPFVNGVHDHPKLSGFSGLPSHVMNTISHAKQHHNGSAPAANLFCWDRKHAYLEESSQAMGFHSRSADLASYNFLHDGNRTDMFLSSALCSPQHACHSFPAVNAVTSAPTSVRMRNSSNYKSETNSGHDDKIKYELDINRVLRGEDNRTTLMIKNIPNKYTSKMLLATIDEQHRGIYDFIYLPIDFKNKCNMGYAFINMTDPLQIIPFFKTFNGKKWEKFNSGKVASLAYARIQGKAALVAHFQNSSLMNEDKRCRPILFCTDGPNAGDQEPFPIGASMRSRSCKPRSNVKEENHNGASPSSYVRGEVTCDGTNSFAGFMKYSNVEHN